MSDTYAVAALVRKRAELAGRLKHARAEIAKMQATLAAIDTALEVFDPEIRAALIPPKRYRPPVDGPYVNLGGKVLLDFLRREDVPLSAPEIAARLLAAAGHEDDDKLLKRASEAVRKTLMRLRPSACYGLS